MQIKELLQKNADSTPAKNAIIFKDQRITFQSLKDSSFRLANSLSKLGIKKSDRIAIYLPNWPEYFYSYLATWCLAATVVPLDFMLTEDELISCIAHCEAKVLIAKTKATISLSKIKESCPSIQQIIICDQQPGDYVYIGELLGEGSVKAPGK